MSTWIDEFGNGKGVKSSLSRIIFSGGIILCGDISIWYLTYVYALQGVKKIKFPILNRSNLFLGSKRKDAKKPFDGYYRTAHSERMTPVGGLGANLWFAFEFWQAKLRSIIPITTKKQTRARQVCFFVTPKGLEPTTE